MAAVQLNVLLVDGSTVITVAIPANMATLQPGLNPVDSMLDAIFRRGYFWNAAKTTVYPLSQIKSITYQ
jgi:hypothetical protein